MNNADEFLKRKRIFIATFIPTDKYTKPPASNHWTVHVPVVFDYRSKQRKAYVMGNDYVVEVVHAGFINKFFSLREVPSTDAQYQNIVERVKYIRGIYERQKESDKSREVQSAW